MKKNIILAIMLLVLTLALPLSASARSTIISNKSFDARFDSWYATTMGGASITQVTQSPQKGDTCVYMTGRTDTWNSFAQDIADKVDNNTTYEFSVWVKLSDEYTQETVMKVGLTTKEEGKNEEYDVYPLQNNTVLASKDEWREIRGTFETAWTGTLEKLEFKVGEESSLNSFYVDEVSVKKYRAIGAAQVQKDIPSLKEVYKDYFSIGAAVPTSSITSETAVALLSKHFNSVTHENDFKPNALLGSMPNIGEDGFPILDFTKPNKILNGIKAHNEANPSNPIFVRGHVLAWHSQTPDWFFREDYDMSKGFVTPEVMNARLEEYIKDVLTYYHGEDSEYPGIIYAWDVINEVINPSDGCAGGLRKTSLFSNGIADTGYYHVYGDSNEYITNAFVYANKYAPANIKLFYNDYDETDPVKSQNIYDLLVAIQNTDGARITGMGMQAHYSFDYPSVAQIETALLKYASLGLEVQLTELDMRAGAGKQGTYEEELLKQAYRYKDIFIMLKRLCDEGVPISNVTVWGIIDSQSWLTMQQFAEGKLHYPLLFDGKYQAKPVFFAIVDPSSFASPSKKTTTDDEDAPKPTLEISKTSEKIDWNKVESVPLRIKNTETSNDATAKLLWDEDYLYVQMTVVDRELNKSNANAYEQDSVEVFLDQNNEKASGYQADDAQYRVNFENTQSFNGVKANADNIISDSFTTADGYIVEMLIRWTDVKPQVGHVIGLDLQVNQADASGKRVGITTWFDKTGMGWTNPSVFGEATLVGETE